MSATITKDTVLLDLFGNFSKDGIFVSLGTSSGEIASEKQPIRNCKFDFKSKKLIITAEEYVKFQEVRINVPIARIYIYLDGEHSQPYEKYLPFKDNNIHKFEKPTKLELKFQAIVYQL
jgi:hypothetical protein